ncbi:zinc finger protein-domain-containing protein [Hypoxylon sp. FL1857]|nr:zinc finger protein-domain-containing protein [Hypoxylon sp. FL1857]
MSPILNTSNTHLNKMLRKLLSLNTLMSTSSTQVQEQKGEGAFRNIGAGACGAIFAREGVQIALKLAKFPGSDLWNDYIMHMLISSQIERYNVEVMVPEVHFFVRKEDSEFFDGLPDLREAAQDVCNLPTDILVSERIPPLPQVTRTLLTDKYCAPTNVMAALDDRANEDCLVRPYLGSSEGRSGGMFFSLRNFELHLNQMLELRLDVEDMASRMAKTLAVMHWAAGTDARDVEFVLGSSREESLLSEGRRPYTRAISLREQNFSCRKADLWLLDFNQVRPITMVKAGVAQAVQAMGVNDPYFPKPLQESSAARKVWVRFAKSYLDASKIILKAEPLRIQRLPFLFIWGLYQQQQQTKKEKPGVNAPNNHLLLKALFRREDSK